jgi:uncharacterized protein (DUF2126 family)/transglutaminase-like putative cysteine protease
MGMKVALHHRSHYQYQRPILIGPQTIQLRPALPCRTPILKYELNVTPSTGLLKWRLDPHQNQQAYVLFSDPSSELQVDVDLVADLEPINPFDFLLDPGFETFPFHYSDALRNDLTPWLAVIGQQARLLALLGPLARTSSPTVDFVLAVNRRVTEVIQYQVRHEIGTQTPDQTLSLKSGSCRDMAWLLVQAFRAMGIASRFVSGYLIQLAAAHHNIDEPNLLNDDHVELHAWAEVFLPGAGWVGLDPTSGQMTAEGHIPLVCTPTPEEAAPIEGTVEPVKTEFTYTFRIERLNQRRSITRPLTDAEWERVRAVAHTIDAELEAGDARLTMGGEPTYVGIDKPESAEWNLDAHGTAKRGRGMALVQALRNRMGRGALLHYGMGKWYPGEPLPRWILSCHWRVDGVPIWEDTALIAAEEVDYGYSSLDAERFITALARRLAVETKNILPAFDPEESVPTATPVGFVLPIRRRQPNGNLVWSSQLWFDRPERLILTTGDSPTGFRIPVETVPWVAPDEITYEMDEAPFADKAKLQPLARRPELFDQEPAPDPLPPITRDPEDAPVLVRSALCAQVSEGRLHIFLPYLAVLADYLDLIAAIEDTCRHLQMPVWLEGYAPSADSRVLNFSVTPDPGVLEINLPPAKNWDELESINTVLDQEAFSHRLTTSKFARNGDLQSTGGGSHIVVGGPSVADSPLLRRPDLLRSLLTFWQNHPSLSYLFSGTYVGPTSQYPRIDQARSDSLYELEVAFRNLPAEDAAEPELLDGLFRNLLADITGNTHRAEFCVDKLYPPDGSGLKLGLLELRAFEMAPHVRMNLLQMLIVRAACAAFWKKPYTREFVRWDTALHDRFMLPVAIERDLKDVLSSFRASGFAFEDAWFGAHFEFRFPRLGVVQSGPLRMELRKALEPWNVLAEESVSGRTVRSVDSSLERVQVTLQGVEDPERYAVCCNGRLVPLQPGESGGPLFAGVRFRARNLRTALLPMIPVHVPLTFDLVDRWSQRSIGRCLYHVVNPSGLAYMGLPADERAAADRRAERFKVLPSGQSFELPPLESNPWFPGTLDLRIPPVRPS